MQLLQQLRKLFDRAKEMAPADLVSRQQTTLREVHQVSARGLVGHPMPSRMRLEAVAPVGMAHRAAQQRELSVVELRRASDHALDVSDFLDLPPEVFVELL